MSDTPNLPRLEWEFLTCEPKMLYTARARVPGGWLLCATSESNSIAFFPDPSHSWNGGSLADPVEEKIVRQWIEADPRWQETARLLADNTENLNRGLAEFTNRFSPSNPEFASFRDRHYQQAARSLKRLQAEVAAAQLGLNRLEQQIREEWKALK